MNDSHCPHCGASLKEWEQRLTPGLVSALYKAYRRVEATRHNRFHLQRDLPLSQSEFTNFQKLQYFRLVENVDIGEWMITPLGEQFLKGEAWVSDSVWTFRNKIMRVSSETVHIDNFIGKIPSFEKPAYVIHQPPGQQSIFQQNLYGNA